MADDRVNFNFDAFVEGSKESKKLTIQGSTVPAVTPQPTEKKRGRPRKSESQPPAVAPTGGSPALVPQTSMSYIQENIPYATAYQDTNTQLDEAIAQLNILGAEVMGELQQVKNSKTLRNKYNYINDMSQTVSGIISSKITAIREKNKTINDINHLELARMKEMKSTANEQDDNQRLANMYDAFVNTPIGMGPLGPSAQDMMMAGSQMPMISLGGDQAMWEQSLDPATNRMVLDAKGMIDTVVMYDAATGNRWFEVVDKQTGQPVPNVEKPSDDAVYNLDINIRGGYAKDSNRNAVYPLVVLNGQADMSEY